MYRAIIFLLLALLCGNVLAQADIDEAASIKRDEARGIDSLLWMTKEKALPIFKGIGFTELTGKHYTFIKEVLQKTNYIKWQHSATVYLFIDSADVICNLLYSFDTMSAPDANILRTNLHEVLPDRKYPEHHYNPDVFVCQQGAWDRPHGIHMSNDNWSIGGRQDDYYHELFRLFVEHRKPRVKVFYSVLIRDDKYDPKNGENIQDDIYQPSLK